MRKIKQVTTRITKRVKNRLSKSKLVQKISRNPRKSLLVITTTAGVICVVCYKVSKGKSIFSLVSIAILKIRGGGESTSQLEYSRVQMDASAIPNTGLVKAQKLTPYEYFMFLVGKVTVTMWIVSLYTYVLLSWSYDAGLQRGKYQCRQKDTMSYYKKNRNTSKTRNPSEGNVCLGKVCFAKRPVRKVQAPLAPLAIKEK